VDECNPLLAGDAVGGRPLQLRRIQLHARGVGAGGRGLHSFTSHLNLSDVYGIGGARRGCVRPC
jgi:hypothetical protein